MNLYLDIETIGSDDPIVRDELAAGILPPGNISKPETVTAWETEKKPALIEDAIKRTSFDGGLGRVICVGLARDDQGAETITGPEPEILTWLAAIKLGSSVQVIGHNISWDVRFLWQRYIVKAIPAPPWLRLAVRAKPWEIADTMLLWNPDRDKRTSLDKLCRILGIPSSKDDMDGSKVWDAYRAGEIEAIARYCEADVVATREAYKRMTA